jgi:hypothetical protein
MNFFNFRKSNRQNGQSTLLMALMVCILIPLVLSYAVNMNSNYSTSYVRTKLLLNGHEVMQGFGTIVQRGYDLYVQNSNACPAGMNMVTGTSNAYFCLPPSPVCLNGYCLDSLVVASQEKGNTVLEARLQNLLGKKYSAWIHSFDLQTMLSDSAFAQRVSYRPAAPAAGTTSNTAVPMTCPGGALCKICDGTVMQCITLRVCPLPGGICTTGQFWVQRYGILLL